MTRDEARRIFTRMLVVWPNVELPDETVAYWLELIGRCTPEMAAKAVKIVEAECRFFPAVADWQNAMRRVNERVRTDHPVPALPAPAGQSDRIHELIAQGRALLADTNRKFIGAKELDRAGVPDWQVRLRDARRRSDEAFDREWLAVKREYRDLVRRAT